MSSINEKWKVTAKIKGIKLPSDQEKLSFKGWQIKQISDNGEVKIEGNFQFPYKSLEPPELFQECFRNFWLFLGCVIGKTFTGIEDSWSISNIDIQQVNLIELLKQGEKPTAKLSFSHPIIFHLSADTFSNIVNSYKTLSESTHSDSQAFQQLLRYFAKAQFQIDHQDRFIWNWLALNIAYNHNDKVSNTGKKKLLSFPSSGFDRQTVINLVTFFKNKPSDSYLMITLGLLGVNTLVELLIGLNLVDLSGKSVSNGLSTSISNDDDVRVIFKHILLCFWQIRSELLHGVSLWNSYKGGLYLDALGRGLASIVLEHIGFLARRMGIH